MKIISWNVNGLRAVHKKGLFLPFVEKYKPDIICLQETKAQQAQSEVDLPDYEEYWNSATRPGYSGTAIFTKHKPLAVSLSFPENILKKYNIPTADFIETSNKEDAYNFIDFENTSNS